MEDDGGLEILVLFVQIFRLFLVDLIDKGFHSYSDNFASKHVSPHPQPPHTVNLPNTQPAFHIPPSHTPAYT
jgi:hypothetical protein